VALQGHAGGPLPSPCLGRSKVVSLSPVYLSLLGTAVTSELLKPPPEHGPPPGVPVLPHWWSSRGYTDRRDGSWRERVYSITG